MTTTNGIAAVQPSDTLGLHLRSISERLHGIPSRTDHAQIADEVARINDAVRAAAARHLPLLAPPSDYVAELLRLAESQSD